MSDERKPFGNFEIDLAERLLFRGGVRVPVRPQVMNALCFLVNNSDRVIRRHELCNAVWPGGIVDDQSLNGLIRDLRKVLDDDSSCPTYLETIPRRGYRFTCVATSDVPRQSRNRRFRAAAAIIALVATGVTVSQITDWGSEPQRLTELSASAQHTFKEGIAEYRSGERLRSRELFRSVVDANPDFPDANLWLAKTYTSNWGADIGDAAVAEPLLHRAVRLKPGIAEAWVELGKIAMITELDAAEGAELARRALQIDPGNLDAHVLLIDMLLALGDAEAAVAVAQDLEAIDPLRLAPMGAQGWISYMAGRFDEAIRQCETALGIGLGTQSARGCLYEANVAIGALDAALNHATEFMTAAGAPPELIASVIDDDAEASQRRFLEWRLARAQEEVAQGGDTYQVAITLQQLGRSDAALEELKTLVRERRYPAIAFIASDPRLRGLADGAGQIDALAAASRQTL